MLAAVDVASPVPSPLHGSGGVAVGGVRELLVRWERQHPGPSVDLEIAAPRHDLHGLARSEPQDERGDVVHGVAVVVGVGAVGSTVIEVTV